MTASHVEEFWAWAQLKLSHLTPMIGYQTLILENLIHMQIT